MRVVLLYPPSRVVPATPFGSLPLLSAILRRAGHTVAVVDANLELFERLIDPAFLSGCWEQVGQRFRRAAGAPVNSPGREQQLAALSSLRAAPMESLLQAARAPAVLRDREAFYEPRELNRVYDGIDHLLRVFYSLLPELFPYTPRFTEEFLGWVASSDGTPIHDILYRDLVPQVLEARPDLVALTIPFQEQVSSAFLLLRYLRAAAPDLPLLVGGATLTVHEQLICADPRYFDWFDYAMPGESGNELPALLEALEGKRRLEDVPYLYRRNREGEVVPPVRMGVADLDALPAPDYATLDLSRYYLPEPLILYQTSRGCYYGKCAFCSFEFREHFRKRRSELVFRDLEAIQAQTGARHFFLWDSLTPPRTLREIAAWNEERGSPLYLAAQTRFEPVFEDRDFVARLERGGVRLLQFGYEAGSQKVLDAMVKGTDMSRVARILEVLRDAGIAVRVTWFIGFPGETRDEALQTYRFLDARRDQVLSSVYTGEVSISPGCDIRSSGGWPYGIEVFQAPSSLYDYRYLDGTDHYDRTDFDEAYRGRSDIDDLTHMSTFLYVTTHPTARSARELGLFERGGALPETWEDLARLRPRLPARNHLSLIEEKAFRRSSIYIGGTGAILELDELDRRLIERADGRRTAAEIATLSGVDADAATQRLLRLVWKTALVVPARPAASVL